MLKTKCLSVCLSVCLFLIAVFSVSAHSVEPISFGSAKIVYLVSQEKLMSRSTLTSSLANYSAENVTMNVATSWESAVAKLDQEIDAIIVDESMRTAVNSQEISELYQNKNLVVATIGIPTSATEEMLNFSALDPQWVPSENDTNDTTQDYAVYAFQSVGNPLEKERFFSSGALNNDEIRPTLDIKEPLSIYFSKSADKLTEQSLDQMMTRIQIEVATLHTPVEAEPTAIGMSSDSHKDYSRWVIIFVILSILLLLTILSPSLRSFKSLLLLVGLLGIVSSADAFHSFNHNVVITFTQANAKVWSYCVTSPSSYCQEKRKTDTANGAKYYLAVDSRTWGSCSADMTGCTANKWKEKEERRSSIVYNSTSTSTIITGGNFYYGIGISKHQAKDTAGAPLGIQYITEYGTTTSLGASDSCYTNGPAYLALSNDGPNNGGPYVVPPGESAITFRQWGISCP